MPHRDNFHYRRSDRRAALALLAVAVGAAALMVAVDGGGGAAGEAAPPDSLARAEARSAPRSVEKTYTYAVEVRRSELFPFDPNTADSTALLRLGLQPWQVRNIYKYRARGGVYSRPEDFARLYGLTAGQYRRLRPYIRIGADFRPAAEAVACRPAGRDTLRRPAKLRAGERIVLNTADSAALTRVPGIGRYYAAQILRYGSRLGGFVSVDQLDEIEGFPPEAKAYLTIANPRTRKMNLNRLSLAQLRRHPYISFYQAKAIIDYRRQHGPLAGLADLRLSRDFTPEAVSRLEPYVEF